MKNLYLEQREDNIYETTVEGKLEVFEFRHSTGMIQHTFIKREVPLKIDGETYYDLVTPFPYGGPLITDCSDEDKWELVDEFERTFQMYCIENRIICETVHFDSVLSNAEDFVCCYEVDFTVETTSGSLEQHLDSLKMVDSQLQQELFTSEIKTSIMSEFLFGKKVWLPELYKKVCFLVEVGVDSDYFPAYRIEKA